jgi:serine protease Do
MKTATISGIVIVLVAFMFYSNGCTMKSSRETPVVKVVRQYAPMVVNIRTESIIDLREHPDWGEYGEQLDLFFKKYFGENYSEGTFKYKSVGSGVILEKNGLIVTNAHVVQRASNIYVVLNDGTMLQAGVIRVSQGDDLAILKTKLPHLVEKVKFGDIRDVMIGETVIAIGNPLGLENSVTVGVVSGKDRAFSSTMCEYVCSGLVQTDASINPGNSGGALLNLDGELVGVNVAVVQNAQNIGFAIPVDRVVKLLEKVK